MRPVRLGPHRIDGAARDRNALLLGRHGAGENRNAVGVVRRAVERIDDETYLALAALAALLGEDGRSRRTLAKQGQDPFLGGTIGVRDQIDAPLEPDFARTSEQLAEALRTRFRRGDADRLQFRVRHVRLESASSSFWWIPPKPPFDMARITSPDRASLESAATMASGPSIQRALLPGLAMSSAIFLASTRSDSGTFAIAVGWLMIVSAAPEKACAYSSWWILRMAVLLRGSNTATIRRPGYCATMAAIVSRTAVGWCAKSSITATSFTSPRNSCLRFTPLKAANPTAIWSGLRPSARHAA